MRCSPGWPGSLSISPGSTRLSPSSDEPNSHGAAQELGPIPHLPAARRSETDARCARRSSIATRGDASPPITARSRAGWIALRGASRVDSLPAPRYRPEADELRASLAAIEERVAELADRPVADPAEVDGRLDALAARVENIVTPDEVVALHESLVAFEQRLAVLAEDAGSTAALDEQARSLAELRATVVELESRPVGDPELDERLARIETQFAERLAAKPDAGQIEALAARLEAGADEHESLATAVAQLGVRIDEMTWRDDGAATRLEELQEQVQALASTLTDVRQGLAAQEDAARRSGSTSSARASPPCATRSPRSPTVTPADRIEQIAHRVEELTAEREAQQALEHASRRSKPAQQGVVTPEHLARALAECARI